MKYQTYNLDCRDVMDMFLEDNSVDSIVTDPPYGLKFMGREWDHGVPGVEFWQRAYRVLKPGGHLLAFGGPRTYHRLTCAIEDAGFEIRDSCIWMFGCLDDQTEVATSEGVKPHYKTKIGDMVLCYDASTSGYSYQPILEIVEYEYCDTAYRLIGDNCDQVVSRNHRVIVEQGGKEVFQFAETLEHEVCVPILESLPALQQAVYDVQQVSGGTEFGLLNNLSGGEVIKGEAWKNDTIGTTQRSDNNLRCLRNRSVESEREAQSVREWVGHKTHLVRVVPFHYSGIVWCLRVPTGAFVAVRNGVAFPTGNSGFPKSHDVSKALDKMAGAEREKILVPTKPGNTRGDRGISYAGESFSGFSDISEPVSDAAKQWDGWGSSLKPAYEPVVVARKPLIGTLAQNVLVHGVGGLNIDATRISTEAQERDNLVYRRLSYLYFSLDKICASLEQVRDCVQRIAAALRSYSTDDTCLLHGEVCQGDIQLDNALCDSLVKTLFPNGVWCGGSSWSVPDFLSGCPSCLRCGDEHIRLLREVAQGGAPSLSCALERICSGQFVPEYTHCCRGTCRLSNSGEFLLALTFSFLLGEHYTLYSSPPQKGRWPANLIHDGSAEVVALFPDTGKSAGGGMKDLKAGSLFQGDTNPNVTSATGFGDSGSAARFFYVPKASRKDRNENCEGVITWENAGLQDQTHSVLSQARVISEATTLHLADSEWNTMLFGSCSTAQYQSGLTFTIRTALKLITTLKTSNYCQNSTTSANILDAIRAIQAHGLSLAESAEYISQLQLNTTSKQMAYTLGAVLAVLKTLCEISEKGKTGNVHSTVKPTDLMAYLCRLVTPPNGVVLDPFMGSGSTGKAALREGFRFIGCELEAEYHAIADARLRAAV